MTQTFPVTITVNEKVYKRQVEPRLLLSDFLRHELGLTGTHVGCGLHSWRLLAASVFNCRFPSLAGEIFKS